MRRAWGDTGAMAFSEAVTLTRGDYVLELAPGVGGAVRALRWRGRDVLRPAPVGSTNVLDMAMFPLAPYANRIAYGRFVWRGRTVQLRRNFGDHPHPLHGHAWQAPWSILSARDDVVDLRFDYAPGDWPWPYRCAQTFALADDGLRCTLSLTNLGDSAMPASLGFHPYFPNRTRARVTARVAQMWSTDATMLPVARVAPPIPLSSGVGLADASFIDNCFTDWGGRAEVRTDDLITIIEAPTLSFLHLYAPQHEDFFCVEPVSAMPDAMNQAAAESGLRVLQPGESFSAAMRIAAARLNLRA